MKKLILISIFALGLNLFANDIKTLNKVIELENQTKGDAILIGAQASSDFSNKEEVISFIKTECNNLVNKYSEFNDKDLVENVVKPNCIEYALKYSQQ